MPAIMSKSSLLFTSSISSVPTRGSNIIENHMDPQILYFHKPHKQKIRHYFWAKEENYIVIIQEEKRFQYFLITAFIVDDPTYYKRYEQDYKNYLSNFKKTHHVDGSIPLSTLTS